MIPLVDLKAQYRAIEGAVQEAITRVLESGQFVLGSEVAAFETEFSAYVGSPHGVGVNSGTSALQLALVAAGVGPGDEVITVPFTFVATAAAIRYTGATPVFVDVNPRTLTMDPRQASLAITRRTKAVVPVHLYGQPADMDPLLDLARRSGIAIIEDACQAHGAVYKGRRVGSIGDFGCFSFYPGKNLGAYGEGGMIVTGSSQRAALLRALRDWGQTRKYWHAMPGFNARLDELQAAVLRVKLRSLDHWVDARRSRAALYARLLRGAAVTTPAADQPADRHACHVYAIRSAQRDRLREALKGAAVETGIHYPVPLHLQPAHQDLGYERGDFPESEQAASEVLSLPMYPELADAQVQQVAAAIHTHADTPATVI